MHPKGAVMTSSTQLYMVTFWRCFQRAGFLKTPTGILLFFGNAGSWLQTDHLLEASARHAKCCSTSWRSEWVLTETSTCYMTEHTGGEPEYWQQYNTVLQYFRYCNCARQFSQRSLVGPTVYVSHHISTVKQIIKGFLWLLNRPHPQKHGGWDSHFKPNFHPQLCWH